MKVWIKQTKQMILKDNQMMVWMIQTKMKGEIIEHLAKGEGRNFRKASFTLDSQSGMYNGVSQ